MKNSKIPNAFFRLFKWLCRPELFEELQGDLEEAFDRNKNLNGISRARAIYRFEVLKMIRPSILRYLRWPSSFGQLSGNYLKTSVRSIKLNPFYISANVMGLAVALSIATVAYFVNQFNSNFNRHFPQAENLYKIHGLRTDHATVGASAVPLASLLEAAGVPAIRYASKDINLKLGDQLFQEQVAFVDPKFFEYFPIEDLQAKYLKQLLPSEIAISRSTAIRLFDNASPINQLVNLVSPDLQEHPFVIKEVFEDLHTDISFGHNIIMSIDHYFDLYNVSENDWSQWIDGTFVYIEDGALDGVKKQLAGYQGIQNKANPELEIAAFQLENILTWPDFEHLLYLGTFRTNLTSELTKGSALISIAILLLACFNFINTSIALSSKRLKEIAVRKVLGGNRKSTITQFMFENAILVGVAVILSVGVSYILIPAFNAFFSRKVIQLHQMPVPELIVFSLLLSLAVTLLSGAYPSLYVSRFRPLAIFREKVILSGKNKLIGGLLTFQFTLCFFLMFGSFFNIDNANYQLTLDRGYELDQVINVPLSRPGQFEVLRDRLKQSSEVVSVAGAENLIGFATEETFVNYASADHSVASLSVGYNYAEVLGLRLHQGKFFLNQEAADKEVIINELLHEKLGGNMLNHSVRINDERYRVIGIVEDFNLLPILDGNKIRPTILKQADAGNYEYAAIKLLGAPKQAKATVESIWYDLFPMELYGGFLQERVMDIVTESNKMMLQIGTFLGVIAILISVIGLYTLIALKVQRKSKEFGIRKVLGAPRLVIIHLLSRELYWILGISATLGMTFSYYQNRVFYEAVYAYYLDLEVLHFVKPIVCVLAIVVLAIGYKVIQTGRMDPVEQLRAE